MEVRIFRSNKRKRTISARMEGDVLLVFLPDRLSATEERRWVERMRERIQKQQSQRERNEAELLQERARILNRRYFAGKLTYQSIEYVSNQNHRWGSCTPRDGTIRLSDRLIQVPAFVRDYIIVHELAHLVEANHSRRFWALVKRYPLAERAIGYLMGWSVKVEGKMGRPDKNSSDAGESQAA